MKAIWIAFATLATLGSLFPFNFTPVADLPSALDQFLGSWRRPYGMSDFVANVILFVPYGFAGFLAYAQVPRAARTGRVLTGGVLLALALQIAQIYLPGRDENLLDVVWNAAGVVAGIALAMTLSLSRRGSEAMEPDPEIIAPLALVGIFLIGRLMPFVPSLDIGSLVRSLKPVIAGNISLSAVVASTATWLMAAYLFDRVAPEQRVQRWLPLIVLCVLGGEALVVYNVLRFDDVAGAAAAVAIWTLVLRDARGAGLYVASFLVISFVVTSLLPWQWRSSAAPFNWMPFYGFLHGSMFVNAQAAAAKLFVFGSIVYCLRLGLKNHWPVVGILAVVIAGVEFLQTRLLGHTPETTDVLLLLAAAVGIALIAAEPTGKSRSQVRKSVARRLANDPGASWPGRGAVVPGWVELPIPLDSEQLAFIEGLSRRTRRSHSRTVRGIIARFIQDCESDDATIYGRQRLGLPPDSAPPQNSAGFTSVEVVRLRESQATFVRELGEAMGHSTGEVVARIVSIYGDKAALTGTFEVPSNLTSQAPGSTVS